MGKDRMLRSPQALPAYHPESNELLAVIETVRGSCTKVSFDPEIGGYVLGTVLPAGTSFPYDFGFIPRTLGEDGDPVDVLVLMDEPVFVGCVVEVRLVGVLEAQQREGKERFRNDRLIAVAVKSQTYAKVGEIEDLPEVVRQQIEEFFVTYNHLRGKGFKVLGMRGSKTARKLLKAGLAKGRRGK